VRLLLARRTADEHAPQAPLKKARLNEVPQQNPAYLPVEAGQPRGVGGCELCRGVHEQIPDSRERFLHTSGLKWLRHYVLLVTASRDLDIR